MPKDSHLLKNMSPHYLFGLIAGNSTRQNVEYTFCDVGCSNLFISREKTLLTMQSTIGFLKHYNRLLIPTVQVGPKLQNNTNTNSNQS